MRRPIFLLSSAAAVLLSAASVAEQDVRATEGQKLLFASNRTGNYEIFQMNSDGTEAMNLTNNPAEDSAPAWSPNAKKIAFVSDRGINRNIYVMDADGSNVKQLTHEGEDYEPAWSPDGKKIAFRRQPSRQLREIFVMDADGSNQVNLTNDSDCSGTGA